MIRRLFREPLLHFAAAAFAIFALYGVLDDSPPGTQPDVIRISDDEVRRLAAEFEATWRRPPGPDELDTLIEAHIREEVYVREALALGLDRDDAVIRRRLQMKMEFLTESGVAATEPDEATLQAHLDANRERFADPPLIGFEQVLLAEDDDGQVASESLARLGQGDAPASVGQPTMLPAAIRSSPAQAIDNVFGPGFFATLAAVPAGVWTGPLASSFGRHLVRVTERHEARLPPLDEIREKVAQDWRSGFVATLRDERFDALRAQYRIERPDPALVLGR